MMLVATEADQSLRRDQIMLKLGELVWPVCANGGGNLRIMS